MEIRPAKLSDLPELIRIYDAARAFMRLSGNINQWTNGYPGADIIRADIRNENSYICTEEG